ncbi:MAG: helix-turn-helix domain-containing protein [Candidatus Marinimicrobia bacterium]|nr:helix-turn-helix domain-containing protein [Candidatus Neomarinimicrobiota bacterium]
MSSIAGRLREFRAAVGLTQREVAELCGIGKRTIIYWEMGDREISCPKLIPLVQDYDLDFNWLIMGSGNMFIDTRLTVQVGAESNDLDRNHQP